jgi:HNH endonuclease
MPFSPSVARELAAYAGFRCSAPFCRRPAPPPGSPLTLGEAAHIQGEGAGSARHNRDPNFDTFHVNEPHNGIWLCRGCHRLVDRCQAAFRIERLHAWRETAHQHAQEEAAQPAGRAVVADANPYKTMECAQEFHRRHSLLAHRVAELFRGNHYDRAAVPMTEALRLGVWHSEPVMAPFNPINRPNEFVYEFTVNSHQRMMVDIVTTLQGCSVFSPSLMPQVLNISSKSVTDPPDDEGGMPTQEWVYNDPIAQLLSAHWRLFNGLLPLVTNVLTTSGSAFRLASDPRY